MLRHALLALPLVLLTGSCAAVAAASVVGFGVVQYHRNEAEQDFALDLTGAWQATLEGLQRLAIVPEKSELTSTEGHIEAGDVSLRVERHPEGFTRVRVRVGTFYTADHRRRAQIVLQEVATAITSQDELRAWVEKSEAAPLEKKKP